jgi:hypothetical protein
LPQHLLKTKNPLLSCCNGKYAGYNYTGNKRMNHHVEQVLQMAVLDKQNLELKSIRKLNDLVCDTVTIVELVIAKR